ncbi:uncharacterized protein GGS22DRAFT_197686 [Annulohypoxylon maeteangense]|uniref:uncharacterized protein n=1 Tax=Annulohypoxylon maeteangense TaxID=1927788 RepID=UPI0020074B93|nr:uncharacterized protein GGS22DRAFT_197686 [Annulohypoxylon maeteangense]KAI0880286.1 hypothetical protein GGS22DRAFT_197686 [Annulohypoxylon maeteangense]
MMTPMKPEALWNCDPKSIHRQLLNKTPKLFAEADNVEIWKTPKAVIVPGVDYKVEQRKLDDQDMKSLWEHNRQFRDVLYIIEQGNLWNRLLITKETWTNLITKHNVFPYFTESILNFGPWEKDDDSTSNNFHSRDPLNGSGDIEICYTISYLNRDDAADGTDDSWSFRQTSVYNRMHSRSFSSVWILVKPSPNLKARLPEKLNEFWYDDEFRYSRHPLIHVMILFISLYGWRDYIVTLNSKMEQFEGKSFFSDTDVVTHNDYKQSFEDLQKLQRLRRDLSKAAFILDDTAELSRRIRGILPKMTLRMRPEIMVAIFEELDDFDVEIRYMKSCIMGLRERTSDATKLFSSILDHLSGKLSLRNALASEASQSTSAQSLSVMTAMAVNGQLGHELQRETSSNIRTLTLVASLYFPASLLVWIFSSNFTDFKSGTTIDLKPFWRFTFILVPAVVVILSIVFVVQSVLRYEERDISTRKRRWGKGWQDWANTVCLSKA